MQLPHLSPVEQETHLRRDDLIRFNPDFKWLQEENFIEAIRYVYFLKKIIPISFKEELEKFTSEWSRSVQEYTEIVRPADSSRIQQLKNTIQEKQKAIISIKDKIYKDFNWIYLLYVYQPAIDELARFLEIKIQDISKIISEAKSGAEEAKSCAEEAKAALASEFITSFSKSFKGEAEKNRLKARNAGWYSFACSILLSGLVLFTYFNQNELSCGFSNPPPTPNFFEWTKWISVRIFSAIILFSFLFYFLKERRNFLHIYTANSHRMNLCNAYLAIEKNMSKDEKTAFLNQLLPHICVLGKTGFISKEEVPLIPGENLIAKIIEKKNP